MGPSTGYIVNILSIVLIDVLLAGDNAVVIAMAAKSLPANDRRLGIAVGAGGAVVLRIALTFFAARLLQMNYIKFAGGALVIWIAVKLLADASDDVDGDVPARGIWHAVWLILVADLTMSVDNILAVAAASNGNLPLLIFGLGLSIPFVIFASNLLAGLMDRYPVIVYLGAAILGRIGGEMMIGDPWIVNLIHPDSTLRIGAEVFFAVAVVIAGWLLAKKNKVLRAE